MRIAHPSTLSILLQAKLPEGTDVKSCTRRKAICLAQIKLQLRCLRYRAGVPLGHMPRLSCNRVPYGYAHVKRAYLTLLRKYDSGKLARPVVRDMHPSHCCSCPPPHLYRRSKPSRT